MPTAYTGRLDEIGLAKESTAGTAIAMTNGVWLPVVDPTYEVKATQDFVPGSFGTIDSPASVRYHVFRRLNTNNHPSYTIYNHSPLVDERAAYCMLDTLAVEAINGKLVSFDAKFMGKALGTGGGAQTPTYTTEND